MDERDGFPVKAAATTTKRRLLQRSNLAPIGHISVNQKYKQIQKLSHYKISLLYTLISLPMVM